MTLVFFTKSISAGEVMLTQDMAQGGTGLSNPTSLGAIHRAVSTVALKPTYDVGIAGGIGSDGTTTISFGAVDSESSPVTLGLLYRRQKSDSIATGSQLPGWSVEEEDFLNPTTESWVAVGVGGGFFQRRVAAGVTFGYHSQSSRFSTPSADVSGNLCVSAILLDGLVAVATVGRASTQTSENTYGGGLRANIGVVAIEGNIEGRWSDTIMNPMMRVGGQLNVSPTTQVLAGYYRSWDSQDVGFTGGVGVASQGAWVGYSVAVELQALSHTHSVGVRISL